MNKKNITVTIGIPAYNEEHNITQILHDVFNQNEKGYKLVRVILISDGSTDNTVALAKRCKDGRLHIISTKKNKGLAYSLNQIINYSESDVLVVFNADIKIPTKNLVEKLITPIRQGSDLVSTSILPGNSPKNFMQSILMVSMACKNSIFDDFLNGQNVYTCHGPVRAFSKKLYTKLHFSFSVGEDMYSYLFAKYNKYVYSYVKDAYVLYTLPTSLNDHQKQSIRFFKSKSSMQKEFGKTFVHNALSIPISHYYKILIMYIFRHPITMTAYIGITVLMKLKSKIVTISTKKWDPVVSSKTVIV